MTKKQYMKKLEIELQALPIEEQKEALDYYSDFLDDAEDEEKAMEELGTPEELAQSIKDKIACVPEKKTTQKKNETKDEDDSPFSNIAFSFKKDEVKSIAISLSAAEVVFITGTDYAAEAHGVIPEDFHCEVNKEGTLIIENNKRLPMFKFFSHSNSRNWHPRILISIPDNAVVDVMKLRVGAAAVRSKELNLSCNRGIIDVGAGSLKLKGIHGNNMDIRCGMGELKFDGSLTGTTNLDCGMGELRLNLSGNPEDYSCSYKVGLGDIKLNDSKKSGIGQEFSSVKKQNHFSVNCGMGSVRINIK